MFRQLTTCQAFGGLPEDRLEAVAADDPASLALRRLCFDVVNDLVREPVSRWPASRRPLAKLEARTWADVEAAFRRQIEPRGLRLVGTEVAVGVTPEKLLKHGHDKLEALLVAELEGERLEEYTRQSAALQTHVADEVFGLLVDEFCEELVERIEGEKSPS